MAEDRSSGESLEAIFSRQWKGVVANYPLVAAALLMKSKSFTGAALQRLSALSSDLQIMEEPPESLINELLRAEPELSRSVGIWLSDCFRQFDRDQGRLQRGDDAMTPIRNFVDCLSRGP